ncbi:hypothetical protein CcaverHIS002_0408690 [Cutaneotrichosporon cavernicola]|nr:hypothetical protein CcaverHIS002_0408690 [Cutaneotrichosporon cavernicola]
MSTGRDIYGTEQDRVNCSFYLKIGACRHGDRCSRKHIRPGFSQTVLLPNVYNNPSHTTEGAMMTPEELQADFDRFYEDFFIQLCKYGNVQEMHVCDNVGDHLEGNVYVRYEWEAEAAKAVDQLNNRWYGMRPLHAELSPVSDFREACCRQNELGECKREGILQLYAPVPPDQKPGIQPAGEPADIAPQGCQRRHHRCRHGRAWDEGLGWVPGRR